MDCRPQTPMNTTTVATAVQRRWACHTRTVLPADAYGRQRRNVVLSACSVVHLRCMSWAVLVREGNKNRHFFTGTYVQNRPQKEKPGKSSYPLPKKKKKRAPTTRATVLGSSSNLDDRFRTAFLCRRSCMVLAKSARTKKSGLKQTKISKFHKYTYVQGSPPGSG